MSSFAHWRAFEGPPPDREFPRDLSDRELLVLVLRSPTLADRVLRTLPVEALRNRTIAHVVGIGLRRERAEQLLAAVELGKRAHLRKPQVPGPTTVGSAADAVALLGPRLAGLDHEEAYVLLLDARNELIGIEPISRGGPTSTDVDPKVVFRAALGARACGLLLVHNHPSGDPTPSGEDHALTTRLASAASLLGLRFVDHLVIAGDRHVSCATQGWLPRAQCAQARPSRLREPREAEAVQPAEDRDGPSPADTIAAVERLLAERPERSEPDGPVHISVPLRRVLRRLIARHRRRNGAP